MVTTLIELILLCFTFWAIWELRSWMVLKGPLKWEKEFYGYLAKSHHNLKVKALTFMVIILGIVIVVVSMKELVRAISFFVD